MIRLKLFKSYSWPMDRQKWKDVSLTGDVWQVEPPPSFSDNHLSTVYCIIQSFTTLADFLCWKCVKECRNSRSGVPAASLPLMT